MSEWRADPQPACPSGSVLRTCGPNLFEAGERRGSLRRIRATVQFRADPLPFEQVVAEQAVRVICVASLSVSFGLMAIFILADRKTMCVMQ